MAVAATTVTIISEAAGRIADAVRTRDELLLRMLASDDGELMALAKAELERRGEAEQAFHDVGAPFRWLADQLDGGGSS